MAKHKLIIEITDEVVCVLHGLHQEHTAMFVQKYSILAKNYFFSPEYKLGKWDGRIRFFTWTNQTYVVLLPEILPDLGKLGYHVELIDRRKAIAFKPPLIDENYFSYCISPKTNEPIILRDYQVNFVNALLQHGKGVGVAATGAGKAQPLDAKVLTPTGWIAMGDVEVGTTVVTPSGSAAHVSGVYPQGSRMTYDILLCDDTVVQSCAEHLWVVSVKGQLKTLQLQDIITLIDHGCQVEIPACRPYEGNGRRVADAYAVGSNVPNASRIELDSLLSQSLYVFDVASRLDFCSGMLKHGIVDVFTLDQATEIKALLQSVNYAGIIKRTSNKDRPYSIIVDQRTLHRNRRIVNISEASEVPTQCIQVDHPEHQYVTNGFVRTHNTFICGAITKSYADVGATSVIIVPNSSLVLQTRREFETLEIETGEYSGKVKQVNNKDIIVSTWQALKNHPEVMLGRALCLVDETHTGRAKELQNLLIKHASNIPHRMGVTGTLPDHPAEAMAVRVAIGDQLVEIPASQLIDRGVLARPTISIMQLVEDLREDYNEYAANMQDELVTYKEFKKKFLPDYSAEKRFLARKEARCQWIADMIATCATKGNTLILVQNIDMGKRLSDLIPGSMFVSGKDDRDARDEVYDLFKGDGVIAFATYGIASAGISIDRVFELILIDPGQSFIRVMQSIGRGLRTSDDKQTVNIRDICSDLTYSHKHLLKRKKIYKAAGYPFSVKRVEYEKQIAVADPLITM